ncbi:TIGR03086 family protein [Mycobacterium sp. CBMA271]|uniref:TIGR03086 family metal-binding protein n=1 Tax=unclassified Mycobacteroides TaxID=2618759 RepID=UPI0012DF0980|nr:MULTISPECIES: TIGR03086 family metal-binding protein [unclassified Mycobacteroides]MUM16035.1 TIGR03086 family protein [Mycobacteroides sp. CBMA 326]MUM22466.1 TIGR03086 family protein [Mycobacteroides sp. CBMA 271]
MNTLHDLRGVHRTAVLASAEIVSAVTPDDLHRPTPCAGWTVADLLAHMTVQHRGFAASARGTGDDLTMWDTASVVDAVRTDPAGAYRDAIDDVLDAFATDGVLDVPFALPEFGPGASFPGATAIGFHFIDYVVHGWDVARSIDVPFTLPDDVITAAIPIALAVPDGEIRATEGSPFARAVPGADGRQDLDFILRHLGRDLSARL